MFFAMKTVGECVHQVYEYNMGLHSAAVKIQNTPMEKYGLARETSISPRSEAMANYWTPFYYETVISS